jgi:hypothetical protein
MKKTIQTLCFLVLFVAVSVQAQKEFKGSVTYAYSIGGDNAEMMAAMMPQKMVVEYGERGMITKMEGGMMAAMMGEIVVDGKNKRSFVKKDNEKTIYVMNEEDSKEAAAGMETSNLKKLKETQEILGYTCTRYEMDAKDVNGNTFTQVVWATPALKIKKYDFSESVKSMVQNAYFEKLGEVFPLKIEFTMPTGNIDVNLEAVELTEKIIEDERFEIPAGYQEKDISEMLGQ